ncbi:MAG: asparagine synthetase B family protein [Rhodocyclaceae bacterium]
MHSRFDGRLSAHPNDTPPPASAAGTLRFAGGYITCSGPDALYEADGRLCLAVGEPRFQDEALRALAASSGNAAAWLHAFREYAHIAPAKAHGRFAVVVIDPVGRSAWLATDRFGTWPVCYAERDHSLRFSDRADAIADAAAVSPQALFEYLYFHMIPAPRTVFEGVRRLQAGHVLHWSDGQAEVMPWWQPAFDEAHSPDLGQSEQRFLSLIEDAVAREAADHSTGSFLSGGTDSSTVCGMLCKVLGRPARSYSIGFDANGYDEMAFARLAARHFGADHREYYVTPEDLLQGIPKVAVHYDQPFGNSSAVPAWICADRARQDGVDKLLAGDGGDELFGGNTRYAKQRVFGYYECLPGPLRSSVIEPLLAVPGVARLPLARKAASYVTQARVPLPHRLDMYNMLHRLGLETLFEPGFLARVDPAQPRMLQQDAWASAHAESIINRMLAYDWKFTLADNDLPKVIGTTQLAGLDVAFPLLTDELLAFSTTLPPNWKVRGLKLRWFFKHALRNFLPPDILTKKKHGFGLPFGVWACRHDGLNAMARDALGSFARRGVIRPSFVTELLDTHLVSHPGYYGEMVWIMMILELWLREHAPDFSLN